MSPAFISTTALALVSFALATPALVPITRYDGPAKQNSYIIKVKDKRQLESLKSMLPPKSMGCPINATYDGVVAILSGESLERVRRSSVVDSIFQDGIVGINDKSRSVATTPEARVARARLQTLEKRQTDGGAGAHVFNLDTGVNKGHECFEGRAAYGANFVPGETDDDLNGHGTHTAGLAIGSGFSIAQRATLDSVKVLDRSGTAPTSQIMCGVSWASEMSKKRGGKSVANMSLGGGPNPPLDESVQNAIKGGLPFTIAAGDNNVDVAKTSPARVPQAITIGAVDYNYRKANSSNFGPLVDVLAFGVGIRSAWITGTNSTAIKSGTSMAAAFVASIVAEFLGEGIKPENMEEKIKSYAENLATGEPAGTTTLVINPP